MSRVLVFALIGSVGLIGLLSCPSIQLQIRRTLEDYRMRRRIARTWNQIVRDKQKYGHLRVVRTEKDRRDDK